MTFQDLAFLISENYLAFLLLGGLLVVMLVYRTVHLPASATFYLIAAVLFAMCVTSSLERWAALAPDRIQLRVWASLLHYILQPLVIYLELVVLVSAPMREKRLFWYGLPLLANTLIYLITFVSPTLVFWYDENYHFHRGPLGLSVYIVTFFYLGLLLYWSVRAFHDNDKHMSIVLLFMACTAIITGALEGRNIISGHIDEAFVFGAFLFHMYLITVYENKMRVDLAHKELDLSRTELHLLRQQVKPHFVFNSLHIVKSLIRKDPPRAIECLETFSEYLRANLDALNSLEPVLFQQELENVKAYVSLALADESKNIHMHYDIAVDDFRLPPLTVEPFVENAFRHGVPDGGNVTLSTREEDDCFVVIISDDGAGFDPTDEAVMNKPKRIGIPNAKTRLEKLCGGTIEFQSGSDGTDVILRIPK